MEEDELGRMARISQTGVERKVREVHAGFHGDAGSAQEGERQQEEDLRRGAQPQEVRKGTLGVKERKLTRVRDTVGEEVTDNMM